MATRAPECSAVPTQSMADFSVAWVVESAVPAASWSKEGAKRVALCGKPSMGLTFCHACRYCDLLKERKLGQTGAPRPVKLYFSVFQ